MTKDESIRNFNKLVDMNKVLDKNNDNYIPPEVLFRTKEILDSVEIQPVIYPSANRSILLEYTKKDGRVVELEVKLEDCKNISYVIKDGEEEFYIYIPNPEESIKVLKGFINFDEVLEEQEYL